MKIAVLLGFIGFAVLQLAPAPYQIATAPVVTAQSVTSDPAVPQPVVAIVRRSCMDCHSYETRLPWYGKVAPSSWMLAKDVTEARAAMNLSDWGRKKAPVQAALAAAMCQGVQSGRMPKQRYVLLHPEAKLSPAEVQTFCAWSDAALASLTRSAPPRP